MNKATISAIIITRNEAEWIEGLLKSLYWVDEIVVLDAQSNDKTVEIARKYTKKVYQHPWDSFTAQKNRLLTYATSEWILAMDADERSTPEFKHAVLKAINSGSKYIAYSIPTRNIFLGREMKHGGWYPDPHIRLFKKKNSDGWTGAIHEGLIVNGPVGKIDQGFIHLSHRNLVEMMEKTIRYSAVEASWRKEHFSQVTFIRLWKAVVKEFYTRAIKYQGYKDGTEGWIEIFYQTFSNFITYARMWELQRKESLDKTYKQIDKEIALANEKERENQ